MIIYIPQTQRIRETLNCADFLKRSWNCLVMLHLYAESTTHIKMGTHFCVGFKEMKVSQFIVKAYIFSTHPKIT